MRAFALACFIFLSGIASGPGMARAVASGTVEPGAVEPTVILLSFDGVRHDYPDRAPLPALERLARDGVRAEALTPIFPSNTFPNHVALATGTHADRHGIVGNRFLDPERGEYDYSADAGFLEAEPLWVAAERQGIPSASFFWVGSETDWRGQGARHRMTPFDSEIPESTKVDQILAWLDLPAEERPRLVMSWWHGADSAGHRSGPDSSRTRAQLAGQDSELLRLIEALDARSAWAHTSLLVVSDHGMIAAEEGIDLSAALDEAGIPGRVLSAGGVAVIWLDDPGRAAEARDRVAAVPGVRAWLSGDVPESLRFRHPTRTGHVVAMTDPPRMLTRRSSRVNRWRAISRFFGNRVGTHGYDPAEVPEMGGILLGMGRGIPAGLRPGRLHVTQVAATVAHLLGIDPPAQSEGARIEGIGEAPSGMTPDGVGTTGGPTRTP